jgi:pimeloyl-ACP methyl ester carboxylesterase
MVNARKLLVDMVIPVLVIATAFIGMLFFIAHRLIYPAPPPSGPWGSLRIERPDLTLRGWVTRPDAPDAWVVFGGNALPLAPIADAWRYCTTRALYLMPYRGYEGQAGSPSETVLVNDGVALVEQAQKSHRRVGIIGISLGTGIATQVAAQTRPDKLLLITPYDRLDLVAKDHFPYLPVRWIMRDTYDSVAAAKQLGGIPVALLQADQDEIISSERTRALAAALPEKPMLWQHVPSSHNGVWERRELCEFVRQGD